MEMHYTSWNTNVANAIWNGTFIWYNHAQGTVVHGPQQFRTCLRLGSTWYTALWHMDNGPMQYDPWPDKSWSTARLNVSTDQ